MESGSATQRLAPQVKVTPDEASFEKFQSTLSSSNLSESITSIEFNTSQNPDKEFQAYRNNEIKTELSNEYEEVIRSIGHFPNLQDVAVKFAQVCAVVDPHDYLKMRPEEDVDFRIKFLETLFEALNNSEHRTPKLRSLSIKNLQNYNDKHLMASANFKSVLQRISELRLRIVTEQAEASPEVRWEFNEMYSFFKELPKTWLQPAQANLTSLTLHVDELWGYIPVCDLRSVHFPQLKKLELGNYTFSHDWQLEWILSHNTLEELILDDCSIVSYTNGHGRTDSEGYPIDPICNDYHRIKYQQEYQCQWSTIFTKIEERLPNLKKFSFGRGNWRGGYNFDVPWLSKVGLSSHDQRYMAFAKNIGPTPWVEVSKFRWFGECMDEENDDDDDDDSVDLTVGSDSSHDIVDLTLEAWGVDNAAYQKLMDTLRARA